MDSHLRNRLLCLGEKFVYIQEILASAVDSLENELENTEELSEEKIASIQEELNAYGNSLRYLNLSINALNSGVDR